MGIPVEITDRHKVERLPPEILAEIDQWLVDTHFTKYLELTKHVNRRLEEEGLEISVGRTSINNYGRKVQARMEQLHTWTLLAKKMQSVLGDDSAVVPQMNLQMVQGLTYGMLIEKGETLTPDQLAKLGRSASDAARASIRILEFQADLEQRTKDAAEKVAELGRDGGLSPEVIQTIEATILGIPEPKS